MEQKEIPEEGDGTPVCIKCFKPVDPLAYYCSNCGGATGQFTHYLPFVNIRWQASVWGQAWRQIWSREVSIPGRLFRVIMIVWNVPIMLIGLLFRSNRGTEKEQCQHNTSADVPSGPPLRPPVKELKNGIVTILKQYSIVCQALGARPYVVCAYSGTDLSQVLGINQASMPEDYYGWILERGDAVVRVSGQTQAAYADFRPNAAKRHLSEKSSKGSQKQRPAEPPSGALDEKPFAQAKDERLSQLPPLLIEVGPYCKLLREARDVFVDGHFYACVAMCGISLERFQRDKAKTYGATRKHKIWEVRNMLQENRVLLPETLTLCKNMADLRNEYAHGHGLNPKEDALKALKWMHSFIDKETNLMRDYVIVNGVLSRKRTAEGD